MIDTKRVPNTGPATAGFSFFLAKASNPMHARLQRFLMKGAMVRISQIAMAAYALAALLFLNCGGAHAQDDCERDQQEIVISPSGNQDGALGITAFYCTPGGNEMTVTVTNSRGADWCSLVLSSETGDFFDSGRLLNPGDSRTLTTGYPGSKVIKLNRWAPGFLGQPGNGGAEAFLQMPPSGTDVHLYVNIFH